MSYRIGFAGLGNMGTPICNNLGSYATTRNLPPLTIWNRSKDKYNDITDCPKAHFAEQVKELSERCNVIFTCLINDQVASEVYGKMLKGVKKEKVVFVDQSTLGPETAVKLATQAKEVGAVYLSCPVFGQPPVAKAKQIVCVVSGEPEAREFVKPLFKGIGRKTIDCGDDVKQGAQIKLLGNMMLLNVIQLFGETYALADAIEFDPLVLHNLCQTLFPAPILLNYSNKISHGTYGGKGFSVDGGLKDAGHVLGLSSHLDRPVPTPTLTTAVENLKRAKDLGPELDWSALAAVIRQDAGMSPFREGTDDGRKPPPPL